MDLEKMNELLVSLEDERRFVFEKIEAVEKFRESEDYEKISLNHLDAVLSQNKAMQNYMTALTCRIEDLRFRIKEKEEFLEN